MNTTTRKHVFLALLASGLLLLTLSLVLNGSPQTARALPQYFFASPSGTDTACSQPSPCALHTALGQAVNGDTIYLAGGTYTGSGGAVITVTASITLFGGWDSAATGPVVRNPDTYVSRLDGQGQRRVVYISGSAAPVLNGLLLTNGSTTGQGGGIHAAIGTHPVISSCEIYSNTSGTHGAGAYFRGGVTLTGSEIHSNTAQGNGGGMLLSYNVDATVEGNLIYHNRANWGAGVQTYMSNVTLTDNDIFSNMAEGSGGGVNANEADSNSVTLYGNRIYDNSAEIGGGVIAGNCFITATGNLIYDNTAHQGGGMWFSSSGAVLVNNIIVGNHVTSTGAANGIMVSGSTLHMVHNTIALNTGGDGIGIALSDFYGEPATVALTNTILVSHTVGIHVNSGHTATLEATLWGEGNWANITDWGGLGSIYTGTVNIWGPPAFLTPPDGRYYIHPGSAAVDAGVNAGVTTDIDGQLRPRDGLYDIGADELNDFLYLPLTTRNHQ
jgi:hypothetical protein